MILRLLFALFCIGIIGSCNKKEVTDTIKVVEDVAELAQDLSGECDGGN